MDPTIYSNRKISVRHFVNTNPELFAYQNDTAYFKLAIVII